MDDIATGIIDPAKLGCDVRTCAIFVRHARGMTVSQISRDLGMTESSVRAAIAGVWSDDKQSAHHTRKAAREES